VVRAETAFAQLAPPGQTSLSSNEFTTAIERTPVSVARELIFVSCALCRRSGRAKGDSRVMIKSTTITSIRVKP
jgi:hypothetical protein